VLPAGGLCFSKTETGKERKLKTDTALKEAPTVGTEAEAGEQHLLETDTAVERPASKISTETTTGEPPSVEADTDVHKSPKIDTKIDHHD
jgi:hypothetical protein